MVYRQVCEITFTTKALHFSPCKATRQIGSKTETNEKVNHPCFAHLSSDSTEWTRWQTNVSALITFWTNSLLHTYSNNIKSKNEKEQKNL